MEYVINLQSTSRSRAHMHTKRMINSNERVRVFEILSTKPSNKVWQEAMANANGAIINAYRSAQKNNFKSVNGDLHDSSESNK